MWRSEEEKREEKRHDGDGWAEVEEGDVCVGVCKMPMCSTFDAWSGSNQSIFDELSNELRQPKRQYYTVHIIFNMYDVTV